MADIFSSDLFGHSTPVQYPQYPGARRTDTSLAAAEAIAPALGHLQEMALRAIAATADTGLTAHELSVRLGVERSSIQPRTSELRRLGKIADSGRRRPNPNGKKAIVWTLPKYRVAS